MEFLANKLLMTPIHKSNFYTSKGLVCLILTTKYLPGLVANQNTTKKKKWYSVLVYRTTLTDSY